MLNFEELLARLRIFQFKLGKYKVTLYKPWIRTNWHLGFNQWAPESLWFIDIGVLQIRKE